MSSMKSPYPTVGTLNEHMEKHQDIKCQYCQKSFAYNRTKAAHEVESCSQHPGAGAKPKKKKGGQAAAEDEPSTSSLGIVTTGHNAT